MLFPLLLLRLFILDFFFGNIRLFFALRFVSLLASVL